MSIYGARHRNMKQIYGYGTTIGGGPSNEACVCEPTTSEDTVISNFYQTLTMLRDVIGELYPIRVVTTPGIGTMAISGRAPFVIIVRLRWVELYGKAGIAGHRSDLTTLKFDSNNQIHLGQLKDIYLENNRRWETDPLFRAKGL